MAIALGILLGHFYPSFGESLKPLGDVFIKLVRMMIAPIIFCTVVHGIASSEDAKKVGRVGVKSIVYFEVITTLALFDLVLESFELLHRVIQLGEAVSDLHT